MVAGQEHVESRPAVGIEPQGRLDYIDGLRALAALWVVVHHMIEVAEPRRLMNVPVLGWTVRSFGFGQFPVMVFLMLSGFCLYYPCVRRDVDSPQLTTSNGAFFARRWRRIAPPYLWAGAFCLALVAIPAFQGGHWVPLRELNWQIILSHLFFVHNLFPSTSGAIDYPMWSIGLEFQLYLLFPIAVWAVRRFGWRPVLAVTLALAVVTHAGYRHVPGGLGSIVRDGPLAYIEVLTLGMLAAWLTVRRRSVAPAWALVAVMILGAAAIRFGSGNGIVHDLATSAAAFALLMLCVNARGAATNVLSRPTLVKIGLFSFSLYLIHAPVLRVLEVGLGRLGIAGDWQFLALTVIGIPVILAVSYGFHCAFERPTMRPRQRAVAPVAAAV